MVIHTYILNLVPSSIIPGTGIKYKNAPLNNKQNRSPNFQIIPPDRRPFNMQEIIREIPREKDAEARPVLDHVLETGRADLFMESYILGKKKGRDKQDL